MSAVQYTGGDARWADQTDPWLQYPDGSVVTTIELHLAHMALGPCEECHGGFFAPTGNGPTEHGIERCDACDLYEGDMEAAVALAAVIGPEVTVWFEPEEEA